MWVPVTGLARFEIQSGPFRFLISAGRQMALLTRDFGVFAGESKSRTRVIEI